MLVSCTDFYGIQKGTFTDIILMRVRYFEVNGDLSHYIFRGIQKGAALEQILRRVGHMHQRMARAYGDLSSDVTDPATDWEQEECVTSRHTRVPLFYARLELLSHPMLSF